MLCTWTPACNTRCFLSKETDEVCSSTSETNEDEDMGMFDYFNDDGFIVSDSMDPQNQDEVKSL